MSATQRLAHTCAPDLHRALKSYLQFNKMSVSKIAANKVVVESLSQVQLFATMGTVVLQAPRSMGFPRREYWRGLHCLLQGIFLSQGSNLESCIGRWILYLFPEPPGKRSEEGVNLTDWAVTNKK